MKVLVTGGAGKVGRWVVRLLVEKAYEVTACGRTPRRDLEGATYRTLDVTDREAVSKMVREHERVIHLAAIPSPRTTHESELMAINVLGTHNVLAACVEHGIDRVALASSINALGHYYGCQPLAVRYFPIDEDHPQRLTDEYSLSKHINEEQGEYFWQKDGLSSVCLRIPGVMAPDERRAQHIRATRVKNPSAWSGVFWCYIDARDSARAFVAGIEAEYEGAHRLFINDAYNILGMPSRGLAAMVYPEVADWRAPIEHDEALITCRRAKEVIGWEPSYSWRGVAAGGALP